MSNNPEHGANIPQAVSRPKKRLPSQLLILILVVGCSAASLYAMRRYGMKSGFQFKPVTVSFKDGDGDKARSYERIMADLSRVEHPLDVALSEFGRSPFMRERAPVNITPNAPEIKEQMSEADKNRLAAVEALKTVQLKGIIGNVARLDDETVRVGDVVKDIFTVKAIDRRSVTFEAYGEEYTLTLEPTKGSTKKAPTRMGTGGTQPR